MARIVGSSFKPGIPQRQGSQETAMDRALASFVSPQGVYLLAQGIGALGKLPWLSKEGGLDLMEQAVKSRNQEAQKVLQQTKGLEETLKAAGAQKDLLQQRDAVMPYEDDEVPYKEGAIKPVQGNKLRQAILAQGQREGETPAEFKARFEGRIAKRDIPLTGVGPVVGEGETATSGHIPSGEFIPRYRTAADIAQERATRDALEVQVGKPSEDRARTAEDFKAEKMIEAARKAGRSPDDINLGALSEAKVRERLQEALTEVEIGAEDLESLSMNELMDLGVQAQAANRDLRKQTKAFQDVYGQQLDPLLIRQDIEASVNRRQKFNQRLRDEFRRRAAQIQERDATEFVEGRIAKQLAGLSPVEQKAQLRRLARSVKSEEDKKEVLELAARFRPVRSTVADYFTSDDDLRNEFEAELSGLLPKIDPLFEQRKKALEAQTSRDLAEAQDLRGRNPAKVRVAEIQAAAKALDEAGKSADKRAKAGKAAKAKEDKKLADARKEFARLLSIGGADKAAFLIDSAKAISGKGTFKSRYNALAALLQQEKYAQAIEAAAEIKKLEAERAALIPTGTD